jgi:hypothetical protein
MEAARIKEARRRLMRAWLWGGLSWSVLFSSVAWGIAWLLSEEAFRIAQFGMILMLVTLLGVHVFLGLIQAGIALAKWARGRSQP